jgi:hypothetical protein
MASARPCSGALDLALDQHRGQRLAAVVGHPDLLDGDDPGLLVDRDLGDVGREGVGGRGADGAAAVVAAQLLGAVAAGGGEGAELRLGELVGLLDRDPLRGVGTRTRGAPRELDLASGHCHLPATASWICALSLRHASMAALPIMKVPRLE